jgi:hypothetical protein
MEEGFINIHVVGYWRLSERLLKTAPSKTATTFPISIVPTCCRLKLPLENNMAEAPATVITWSDTKPFCIYDSKIKFDVPGGCTIPHFAINAMEMAVAILVFIL